MHDRVLQLLEAATPQALLLTELEARVQAPLTGVLSDLERSGQVVVTTPTPPDPHLEGLDLRIVARARPERAELALQATDAVWQQVLRAFLSSHRCQ
jgi:hypothetical protein